jgi:ankyrin repeat protein
MGATEDTALLAAARSGDVAACRAALDSGADKNCKALFNSTLSQPTLSQI